MSLTVNKKQQLLEYKYKKIYIQNLVERNINRELLDKEKIYILKTITYIPKTNEEINVLVNKYISQLSKNIVNNVIDSRIYNNDNKLLINLKKAYVLLDSFNRQNRTPNANYKKMSWEKNVDGNSSSINSGSRAVDDLCAPVGTYTIKDDVKNIVSMKLYILGTPKYKNINFSTGNITILIEEFKTQSTLGIDNRSYHFLTKVEYSTDFLSSMVLQTEGINNSKYDFSNPISTLSSLTLSFGIPNIIIDIPPDIVTFSFINITLGIMTFTTTFDLGTVDLVYYVTIINFTTATPTADKVLIDYINNTILYADWISNILTVSLPTDFLAFSYTPVAPVPTDIVLNNNRFTFGIEFTYFDK